jgi:hypothetical protein
MVLTPIRQKLLLAMMAKQNPVAARLFDYCLWMTEMIVAVKR